MWDSTNDGIKQWMLLSDDLSFAETKLEQHTKYYHYMTLI